MAKTERTPGPLRQQREPDQEMPNLEPIQDFSELNLFRLPWARTGAYNSPNGTVYPSEATGEFFFQGRQVALLARHIEVEADRDEPSEEYRFELIRGNGHLYEQIHLAPTRECINATTDIVKEDPEQELPRGIGLELYRKSLHLLQELADRRQLPVDHIVTRYPEISSTPLSIQRWNELFLPILEEYGYQELPFVETGTWSKRYEPVTRPKPRSNRPQTLGFSVRRRDLTD